MKDFRMYNKALLGKWIWTFGMEETALWRVVVDKYGIMDGGSSIKNIVTLFRYGLWRSIMKG